MNATRLSHVHLLSSRYWNCYRHCRRVWFTDAFRFTVPRKSDKWCLTFNPSFSICSSLRHGINVRVRCRIENGRGYRHPDEIYPSVKNRVDVVTGDA